MAGKVTSNHGNDGRGFETMFERTCDAYRSANRLRLQKVEPPVRVIGWGEKRKVIFLENPFPDYIGAWTERGGQTLCIEVKSTSGEDGSKLQICKGSGGLRDTQLDWLIRWHRSGAAVGIVWEWVGHGWAFIPVGLAESIRREPRRHIKFSECEPILQGQGFAMVDFLTNLSKWYAPKADPVTA